ncbi:MAG: DNA internalization-related competence protein ComEC/Rec2 [Eubacteriales bacterium]|nr:DNA internalization-related competence protein ComEC/Rec2 [Eubacteriales bacterium]
MRKLLIFSIVYALTTICAGFFLNSDALVIFCAVSALLGLLFSFNRKKRKTVEFLRLFFLAAACAVISFILHEDFISDPCRTLDGLEREITVSVSDYPETGEGYQRVRGRILSDEVPAVKIILYSNETSEKDDAGTESESTFNLLSARPGDKLTVTAKMRSADHRYGKPYDGYYSSGVFLIATAKSEISCISREGGFLSELRYLPVNVSHRISEAVSELFDSDIAPFMKSLLLNDRDDFYADASLPLSLSRSGIMHIVAVSGMHIAFLVGFFQLVFGKRRRSSLLCLLIIWFFVLMTGAVPSAVRAGFMQSMLLLAPFFRRENDPPTSLAFALLILLAINPYAIRSVSLQLSFAAVAGIILVSVPLYQTLTGKFGNGILFALLKYVIGIISSSLGVMIFTLPLTAWHFGTVSVLSVITNILVIWAVSICFGGGFIASAVYCFSPQVGKIIAVPFAWLARYILNTSSLISKIPFSTMYISNSDNSALYWMISVYLIFGLFRLFRKMPEKFRIIVPALLSLISLCLTVSGTKLFYQAFPAVYSVVDVGQGQCLSVFSGDETVIIDCGSVMTADNAGEVAGKYLLSCGRSKINTLILTHLHEDHAGGVAELLEYIPVDEIILSSEFASDKDQLPAIKEAAKAHSVRITYITSDTEADVGSIHLRLFAPTGTSKENQNEKCLMCVVSIDDYDMLVTADAPAEIEKKLIRDKSFPQTDLLILGHHGSKTSSSEDLLRLCPGATGVISVGYNTYGHPSEEVLDRASGYLGTVYRTDRDGTVQLILDNGDMIQCLKSKLTAAILNLKLTA